MGSRWVCVPFSHWRVGKTYDRFIPECAAPMYIYTYAYIIVLPRGLYTAASPPSIHVFDLLLQHPYYYYYLFIYYYCIRPSRFCIRSSVFIKRQQRRRALTTPWRSSIIGRVCGKLLSWSACTRARAHTHTHTHTDRVINMPILTRIYRLFRSYRRGLYFYKRDDTLYDMPSNSRPRDAIRIR